MNPVDSGPQKHTGGCHETPGQRVVCDGGESQDPFAPIREYEETIADIAAGNGPDAHVARVLLALERGEQPNPDDLERLCTGPGQQDSRA
jgi:hypothetical protein